MFSDFPHFYMLSPDRCENNYTFGSGMNLTKKKKNQKDIKSSPYNLVSLAATALYITVSAVSKLEQK